jgi:hypothetical protein
LAIPTGFEPVTHGVEIRYSIQLSYGTVGNIHTIANMKNQLPGRARSQPFSRAGATKSWIGEAFSGIFADTDGTPRSALFVQWV